MPTPSTWSFWVAVSFHLGDMPEYENAATALPPAHDSTSPACGFGGRPSGGGEHEGAQSTHGQDQGTFSLLSPFYVLCGPGWPKCMEQA